MNAGRQALLEGTVGTAAAELLHQRLEVRSRGLRRFGGGFFRDGLRDDLAGGLWAYGPGEAGNSGPCRRHQLGKSLRRRQKDGTKTQEKARPFRGGSVKHTYLPLR